MDGTVGIMYISLLHKELLFDINSLILNSVTYLQIMNNRKCN